MTQETSLKTKAVYELADGSVAVCYGFKQFTVNVRGKDEKWWRCTRIDFSKSDLFDNETLQPDLDKVYTAFIREKYSADEVEAMVNNYYASITDIEKDEAAEQEYLDFLKWRKALKDYLREVVGQWCAANPMPEPQTPETAD